MIEIYNAPVKNAVLRVVGIDDLVKYLEITEEEARFLGSKIIFNFWYVGEDLDSAKKWTFDGDDIYSEFSYKEFLLSQICDCVCGGHILGKIEFPKQIETIANLHKNIHFACDRVTIKDKYVGQWKNWWRFDKRGIRF